MVLNLGLRVYGLQFPADRHNSPKIQAMPPSLRSPTLLYARPPSSRRFKSGACRVISSTTGEDEPRPIRRVPLTMTTSIRVARGEPPANPLGAVVGLTLGWLAASLEQSVPLTERRRGLGERREWASDWSFIQFGLVSLRIEGSSFWFILGKRNDAEAARGWLLMGMFLG